MDSQIQNTESKSCYYSKTIWTNVFAIIGLIIVGRYVDTTTLGEITATGLGMINIVLRIFTNEALGN